MSRPYTDITKAINSSPIKNGTAVVSATTTGRYNTYNQYVNNKPIITNIQQKYGNRFYNGILVTIVNP